MSRKSVGLALVLAGGLSAWTPRATFAQTQLIRNGAFAGNVSPGDWARSGNFYPDSRFDRCRSCPGYAYVSNPDGTAGNNLSGNIGQVFAIPAGATPVQLTYWTYITSDDAGRGVRDNLNVWILNSAFQFQRLVATHSNLTTSTGYVQSGPFSLNEFSGQIIVLYFEATTDSILPTVFRLDDVSIIATIPTCTDSQCAPCERCQSNSCVSVSCSGCNVCNNNHGCTNYACCGDSDCGACQTCNTSTHTCQNLSCSGCNVCNSNHGCTNYACCTDSNCGVCEKCQSNTCVPVSCPIGQQCESGTCRPTGACCISYNCYTGYTQTNCENQGGVWQGANTTACQNCTAPPTTGACCNPHLPANECIDNTRDACLNGNWAFAGVGVSCTQAACADRCDSLGLPCDYCWRGTSFDNNCPSSWATDADCDCGCQFSDPTCQSTVPTPTISPNGGTHTGSVEVTLACSDTLATIRYTTNDNDPTSSSTLYTAPFTLTSSATVKARGFRSAYNDSATASANFVVNPDTSAVKVFGVDVSSCQQKTIDWAQVKQAIISSGGQTYPITFAMIRASKGRANTAVNGNPNCQFVDPKFAIWAPAAMNACIFVGPFHVAAVINPNGGTYPAVDEARFFVNVAGDYIRAGNMRPALDLEDQSCGHPRDIGWPALSAWVDEWMIEVHRLTQVWPLIYCSDPYKSGLGGMLVSGQQTLASKYDLWIADPRGEDTPPFISPWTTSVLHQYSWSGSVTGMEGQPVCNPSLLVDMDVFHGSLQNFQSTLVTGSPNPCHRSFTYSLTAGLNFISFPFNPQTGGSISEVASAQQRTWATPSSATFAELFAPLGDDFFPYVFPYNEFTFDVATADSLTAEPKKGYFIYLENPRTITLSGDAVDDAINLQRDWNVTGVTSDTTPSYNPDVFPFAFAYRPDLDPDNPLIFTSLSDGVLQPGLGYFIMSYVADNPLDPAGQAVMGVQRTDSAGLPKIQSPSGPVIGPDFACEIVVEQVRAPSSATLSFGMNPGATDEYDEGLDGLREIPLPEAMIGFFDDGIGPTLAQNYKAAAAEKQWPLTVFSQASDPEQPDNLNPIVVSWTFPSTGTIDPSSRFQLLDGANNVLVPYMSSTSCAQFAITAPSTQLSFVVKAQLGGFVCTADADCDDGHDCTRDACGNGVCASTPIGGQNGGSIVAWGVNDYGQLDVPAPNTGFTAGAGGFFHSLGLKADGSVVAWGDNSAGQANVPASNTGFTAVAAGAYHSLGLKSDGSIVGWGNNYAGQLDVPAPNAGFTAVAAGLLHSLAVRGDGSIVAFGRNDEGELDVPAPNIGFRAVAAGYVHSLGLKVDGSIVAWGSNDFGQTSVPFPNSGFVAVAAGELHSLGLKEDGSIVAWGRNSEGQLDVPTPNTAFTVVAAGGYHSLGLKGDGSIVAWGANWYGQTNVPTPNTGFVAVVAARYHGLGLRGRSEFGDSNSDGDVDLRDFAAFQACFGVTPIPEECRPFDVNRDDRVNIVDWHRDTADPPQFCGFRDFISDCAIGGPRETPAP